MNSARVALFAPTLSIPNKKTVSIALRVSTPSLKRLSLIEKIQREHRSLFCQLYPCNAFISQSCVAPRTWSLCTLKTYSHYMLQQQWVGARREKIIKRTTTLVSLETNGNAGSLQAKSRSGSCSGPSMTLHTYSPHQRELESIKSHMVVPMANTALAWSCTDSEVEGNPEVCPTLRASGLVWGKQCKIWPQKAKIELSDLTFWGWFFFFNSTHNLCPGNYLAKESISSLRIHQQIFQQHTRDWQQICFSTKMSKPKEKALESPHRKPWAAKTEYLAGTSVCLLSE